MLAGLLFPRLIRILMDDVLRGQRQTLMVPVFVGMLGIFFARDLFASVRMWLNSKFEQHVLFDLRCDLYGQLQRLPLHHVDRQSTGDMLTRVTGDVHFLKHFLGEGIEQGVIVVMSVLLLFGLLLLSQPTLTALALLPLPFLLLGTFLYTPYSRRYHHKQRLAESDMSTLLVDNIQGLRQIKTFAQESYGKEQFAARASEVKVTTLASKKIWSIYVPAMAFLEALGLVGVLWIGSRRVLQGSLSTGQLSEFVVLVMMFYAPINKIPALIELMIQAHVSIDRVSAILNAPQERANIPTSIEIKKPVLGEVRYQDVHFSYSEGREVLKGVSLHARPGQTLALVGPTGSGKSTLMALLSALYEPTSGHIMIDNQDIGDIDLKSLRKHISVVSQEPFLFNTTLRENLLFGRPEATEEEIIEACRAANCHDFIQRLEHQYDTYIGERGVLLSTGEKQRVNIARALLVDAPILVLDEATASVDNATERSIQKALEVLMAGRTSFVIAHRLSTIQKADNILVLKEGQVVESGTHHDLLQQDGVYALLVRVQHSQQELGSL